MNNSDRAKFKSVTDKIKNSKSIQYIIVVLLAVVVLFVSIGSFTTNNENKNVEELNVDGYVEQLESRLECVLSSVDGVGRVEVMITVESGMETVLAMEKITKESQGETEIIETPIMVNGKTVTLKELYPKIVGVFIVAEGANSIAVLSRMQQATVSLLDINIDQIEILTMKK